LKRGGIAPPRRRREGKKSATTFSAEKTDISVSLWEKASPKRINLYRKKGGKTPYSLKRELSFSHCPCRRAKLGCGKVKGKRAVCPLRGKEGMCVLHGRENALADSSVDRRGRKRKTAVKRKGQAPCVLPFSGQKEEDLYS